MKETTMAVPTLSSVSPNQGPSAGGTTVTLSGTGFTGVTSIKFGSVNTTSFTVTSSTQIVAVTPSGTGVVNVTVTTGEGTSAQTVTYTYVAVPVLSSVTPTQGPTSGGTTVVLTGTGFTGASAVRFDGIAATFTVNSPTQITVTTPAHAAGAAAVTVTTPGGTSNPLSYVFLQAPTLTSLSPNQGPTTGGNSILLTGTNLTTTTSVQFGGTPASFTVVSPTQVTATPPAGVAGAVIVTATTAAGVSNGLAYIRVAGPVI
jgi:IPT/TIG domain-containing protein